MALIRVTLPNGSTVTTTRNSPLHHRAIREGLQHGPGHGPTPAQRQSARRVGIRAGTGQGGLEGPQRPARNWRRDARLLFPWLPEAAIGTVAREWERTGDPNLGLAAMREDPRYSSEWFPGNRRDDGSVRLSEQEYLAWVEGYQLDLAHYGVNPQVFKQRFPTLIEHGVSPEVLARRLQAIHSDVMLNIDQVQQVYASYYGMGDMTPQTIFAMAIDPQVTEDVLARRITASQIGGTAATFGFARGQERSERLAAHGLTQERARELYAGAAQHLPRLGSFARRYGDPMGQGFTIGQFEQAGALGDPEQLQRMGRLSRAEQSSFSPFGRIAQDETGVRGLRPR